MTDTTSAARRHWPPSGLRLLAALCLLLAALPATAKDISVGEAVALLKNPPQGLTIVDVRTPAEFREGHLPGAVNMDYFGGPFEEQILDLPKDKAVLLYCRTGNRSASAGETMQKAGMTNILHMNQGISQWQKEGLPLEK